MLRYNITQERFDIIKAFSDKDHGREQNDILLIIISLSRAISQKSQNAKEIFIMVPASNHNSIRIILPNQVLCR